ncbi:MAG: DUF4194 domain-containing protein [Anaerobiospirillum sp.]|nr:DUF4194 domain-containing protein [Anaerobiospirillum sp.]
MSLFDDERENQDDLSSDGASTLTLGWGAEGDSGDLGAEGDLDDSGAWHDRSEDVAADAAEDSGDDVAVGVAGMAEALEEPAAAPSRMKLVPPGALMVFLLKNYIDREDDKQLFESLVRQEREVEEFCRRLFLRLVVDHESGYAYVRSLTEEELPQNAGQRPPQLLTKRALPFYDSMVLILLRQRLLEFELSGQFGRLVLERSEILTMVKTFVHNVNNDKRLDDNLNKAIDNLCSLGLLGKNKSAAASSTKKADRNMERIEVKRIISVIVTPEILKQADEILASYVKHIKEGGRAKNKLSSSDEE